MAVSFFGLLVLAVVGLLVLGGLVALVALLANPKTRAAGAIVLVAGLLVLLIGGLLIGGWVSYRLEQAEVARPAVAAQRAEAQDIRLFVEQRRRAAEEEQRRRAAEMEGQKPKAGNDGRMPADASKEAPAGQPAPSAPAPEAPPVADPKPEAPTGTEQPAADQPSDTNASSAVEHAASKQPEPPATQQRPQWVDQKPGRVGGIYQLVLKTDPRPTREQCESELPGLLQTAVTQYVETELNRDPGVSQRVQLPLAYIQDHMVKQTWPEPVQISLGKWVQLHVLLQVDQEAKRQIENECGQVQLRVAEERQQASVLRRVWYSGAGLAAVLALLSLLFVGLKIDQATNGTYRGRLCLATGAVILVVAGAAFFTIQFLQQYPVAPEVSSPSVPQVEPAAYSLFDPGSPQPAAAVILYPAKLIVLSIGLLLLGTLAVALTISRKARSIGLALLALLLLGSLAVVLAAARSHMPVGPVELLVIAVIVVLPVCVLYAVVAFAWRSRRRRIEVETPARERADVDIGQP